jgi:hypothetical protein
MMLHVNTHDKKIKLTLGKSYGIYLYKKDKAGCELTI